MHKSPITRAANTAVIIPNWNGKAELAACLDSLLKQSHTADIVVVENGSIDGSVEFLAENYAGSATILQQPVNLGFAGGVNVGIRYALEQGYEYVALFNNDAVADERWLDELIRAMHDQAVGITTCRFMSIDGSHLDSTGDLYTNWGLPYPRGRGETAGQQYDRQTEIFAASGGASLYCCDMLRQIGLFDEDFFAYYEDVDMSFRAQLAGWQVRYVPQAIAYHATGSTSSKIKGFTTYQTMKNQPLLLIKNVPRKYLWRIGWRFLIAYKLFFLRAVSRGQGWPALKGVVRGFGLLPRKLAERRQIQRSKTVSDDYIWAIITHDLPPNAQALRRLRAGWWKLIGRHSNG